MKVVISKKLVSSMLLLGILLMIYFSYINLNNEKKKINTEDYFTNL